MNAFLKNMKIKYIKTSNINVYDILKGIYFEGKIMEIRRIGPKTSIFNHVCDYVEQNINRENLSINGGTLNYSNLTYESDILLVALDNGVPVGYNSIVTYEDGLYIYQIAVKKEYQNKGVGTLMLKKAIEIAKKTKYERDSTCNEL